MSATTWPSVLENLLSGKDLDESQSHWAMDSIMSGAATSAQIAGFLVALRAKGTSGAELAWLVDSMLDHSLPVEVSGTTVDTCGTGGDNSHSANISTMAAVVVAAAGQKVVKHGNRSASSQSGSADVLEALGIPLELSAEQVVESVNRASIGFCFARTFHPAMRFAGPVRAELGIRTIFNVLGPLANPARPAAQVVGVADVQMAPIVAAALAKRGTSALVVRGEDGLDEVTTTTTTRVWDCRAGSVSETVLDAADLGIPRVNQSDLRGGDATRNAEIMRSVLEPDSAEDLTAIRDAVLVNAAAALVAADSVGRDTPKDLLPAMQAQLERAKLAVESGAASEILDLWEAAGADMR
ncbi:MAG: anthranilate phosphoribosyltransferase [Micrococcales bacterium]|nr:anthranilate phosphoribosyltransferase [Micrococcales bacterium]